jgi:hypothetical protein
LKTFCATVWYRDDGSGSDGEYQYMVRCIFWVFRKYRTEVKVRLITPSLLLQRSSPQEGGWARDPVRTLEYG